MNQISSAMDKRKKPELSTFRKFIVEKQIRQFTSRQFCFSYLTANIDYLDAVDEYGRFLKYVEETSVERTKSQLTSFLFPLFVHLYLLMLQISANEETGIENARGFYMKYSSLFHNADGYEDVLKELYALDSVAAVKEHQYFKKFWKRKYTVEVDSGVLDSMKVFLERIESKALLYVLHFHFCYDDEEMAIPAENMKAGCSSKIENMFLYNYSDLIEPTNISTLGFGTGISCFWKADINQDESEIAIACNSHIALGKLDESCGFIEVPLSGVSAVQYIPSQPNIILASYNTNVKMIDTTLLREVKTYDTQHTSSIWDIDIHPSASLFATASKDFTTCVWDFNENSAIKQYCYHEDNVSAVKFHPNGFYFATGSSDGSVLLWTIEKSIPLRRFSGNIKVNSIALSSDGKMLASAGGVKIWTIEESRKIFEVDVEEAPGSYLCFNDLNTRFAVCNEKGFFRIWDVRCLKEIVCKNLNKVPLLMKFNKNKQWKIVLK